MWQQGGIENTKEIFFNITKEDLCQTNNSDTISNKTKKNYKRLNSPNTVIWKGKTYLKKIWNLVEEEKMWKFSFCRKN